MKKIIVTSVFVALTLNSCNFFSNKQEGKTIFKATLIQEWFPNANYAGELLAMYETDSINDLELTIKPGSDESDPIKLVIGGTAEFGIVSADRIIQANEIGSNLVVIGVANYKSPTCFISKMDKNIKTVKDFEGKKIGILTGTNTELIYKSLILKNKLDKSKLKEIEAPFDLATFISDEYDVRPAFVYDEPVSLDLKSISYNMIKPEDYGVKFLGTVYFCKKELIEQQPELVLAFVKSIKEGWKETFKNPTHAIDLLKKFDKGIDKNRESKSLAKAIEYFKGENDSILFASEQSWENMAKDLKSIGKIKSFDFGKNVNYNFLKKSENDK